MCELSCIRLFVTPWTVACQAPLSMGFSRQEYWSGLSFSPPEDLLNPGIEPVSPESLAVARHWATWETQNLPQWLFYSEKIYRSLIYNNGSSMKLQQ